MTDERSRLNAGRTPYCFVFSLVITLPPYAAADPVVVYTTAAHVTVEEDFDLSHQKPGTVSSLPKAYRGSSSLFSVAAPVKGGRREST